MKITNRKACNGRLVKWSDELQLIVGQALRHCRATPKSERLCCRPNPSPAPCAWSRRSARDGDATRPPSLSSEAHKGCIEN